MTVEEIVYATLAHLAEGRVFPDVAESSTGRPYITFQAVGGTPINFITGETPTKQSRRVQVNCWAERRVEASELGMLVEDSLRSATDLQVEVLTGLVSTHDEQTNLRGTMQDFSLFC